MKKFLLTMAAVVGLGFASQAADVTITASQVAGGATADTKLVENANDSKSWTAQGYTFTFNANGNGTVPQYYATGSGDIRMYAKATVNIKGPKMTKMVFTLSNVDRPGVLTCSTGSLNLDYTNKVVTWTGEATEVTITVPELVNDEWVTLDKNKGKPAQFRWAQVVISGDGQVTPQSAAPVISPASGTVVPAEGLTVTITAADGAKIYYTTDGTNPTADSDEYVSPIAVKQACTVKAIAVEEGKDASSVVTAVYKAPAVTVADIAAFKAKADTENPVTITGPVIVSGEFTYGSGQSLYVQDASGYLLIFSKDKKLPVYSAGDRLSNITGTYALYNEAAQMVPDAETFGAAVAGEAPQPKEITVTEPTLEQQNLYVKLSNVSVETSADNAKDHYAVSGTDKILLYNRFNITFPEDGAGYDVYGYVGAYFPKEGDPTVQVYPAEIVKAGQQPEKHEAATIAEFLEKAKGDTNVWTITGEVKTVYQQGNNLYIQDVAAPYTGLLVFGTLGKTYEPGTILKGIKGTYTNYYSTIELTAEVSSFTDGTKGDAPAITKMGLENITADIQNLYVELDNVTVSGYDSTVKTFTITDAKDDTVQGYNKWSNSVTVPEDTKTYNIKGFVSYYQAKGEDAPKVQIYPVEFVDAAGINGIGVDLNATDAEYYNLQGIRVSEPEQGIYIVRQGGKTAKVIIRK